MSLDSSLAPADDLCAAGDLNVCALSGDSCQASGYLGCSDDGFRASNCVGCPQLAAPASGSVQLVYAAATGILSNGARANFSCDAGNTLIGQQSLLCQSDNRSVKSQGSWSDFAPICYAGTLPRLAFRS